LKNNVTNRLMALIEQHPAGIASNDAAAALGNQTATVCECARALAAEHRIAIFRQKWTSIFVVPQHAQKVRERLQEELLCRQEERRLARVERDAKRTRKVWMRNEAWAEGLPVQRVLAASKARPLGKVGPASIFEVAA